MSTPRKLQLAERSRLMFDPVDPAPMEAPTDLAAPLSFEDRVRAFIRNELSAAARSQGDGTFSEEDDFEEEEESWDLSDNQVMLMAEEFYGGQEANSPDGGETRGAESAATDTATTPPSEDDSDSSADSR